MKKEQKNKEEKEGREREMEKKKQRKVFSDISIPGQPSLNSYNFNKMNKGLIFSRYGACELGPSVPQSHF